MLPAHWSERSTIDNFSGIFNNLTAPFILCPCLRKLEVWSTTLRSWGSKKTYGVSKKKVHTSEGSEGIGGMSGCHLLDAWNLCFTGQVLHRIKRAEMPASKPMNKWHWRWTVRVSWRNTNDTSSERWSWSWLLEWGIQGYSNCNKSMQGQLQYVPLAHKRDDYNPQPSAPTGRDRAFMACFKCSYGDSLKQMNMKKMSLNICC